jgi:hypothetical protein
MTTIVTGHKNGLIRIWNYSYNIIEKTQTVKWDIFMCRTIETNMSSITALTIPSSHRFILAGDSKGVVYPWIMLDGSGTTLHYNVSEDACKACNNKFAVFDRFKIRCVGCGYFYCNECTYGIQQFEKDNKICKFCLKKISEIDNRENEENNNNHTSSLSLSEELIVEPSTQDLFQSEDVNDNKENKINDNASENEINKCNNDNDNEMSINDSNINDHNIYKNSEDSPIINIIHVSNDDISDKKNESIDENGINNDKMEEKEEEKEDEKNKSNVEPHPLNNENNENEITDTKEDINVKENNKIEDGTPILDIKINNIIENINTSNDKTNELTNIIRRESQHELQQ